MNEKERLVKAKELLAELERWSESPDQVDSPPVYQRLHVLGQVRIIRHLLETD